MSKKIETSAIVDGENLFYYLANDKSYDNKQILYDKIMNNILSNYDVVHFVFKRTFNDFKLKLSIRMITKERNNRINYYRVRWGKNLEGKHDNEHYITSVDDYYCVYLLNQNSVLISNDKFKDLAVNFTTYITENDILVKENGALKYTQVKLSAPVFFKNLHMLKSSKQEKLKLFLNYH